MFGLVGFGQNSVEFSQVGPGQNLDELALAQNLASQPRPKVIRVPPMLKFGRVSSDKKIAKFNGVGPKNTSFRKFNLNFFYKKYILDFEPGPNIWIWI